MRMVEVNSKCVAAFRIQFLLNFRIVRLARAEGRHNFGIGKFEEEPPSRHIRLHVPSVLEKENRARHSLAPIARTSAILSRIGLS